MAGMRVAAFHKAPDGRLDVRQVAHHDRMTLAMFKGIYKGRVATPQEIKAANIRVIPDGMGVWRRDDGSLLAIRNENEVPE